MDQSPDYFSDGANSDVSATEAAQANQVNAYPAYNVT
jgi:hypothetical protein